MNIFAKSVTTTTALLVRANRERVGLLIYNNGGTTIELVSSEKGNYGTGIPVASGSKYSNQDHCKAAYYAVSASGTVDVRIEEDIEGMPFAKR